MKILITLFLLLLSNSSFAQWNKLMEFFHEAKNENIPSLEDKRQSFKFIQPPKDIKKGNFSVSCYFSNGTIIPHFDNLQVNKISTGFTNYTFTTIKDEYFMAPIDFCFIKSN